MLRGSGHAANAAATQTEKELWENYFYLWSRCLKDASTEKICNDCHVCRLARKPSPQQWWSWGNAVWRTHTLPVRIGGGGDSAQPLERSRQPQACISAKGGVVSFSPFLHKNHKLAIERTIFTVTTNSTLLTIYDMRNLNMMLTTVFARVRQPACTNPLPLCCP